VTNWRRDLVSCDSGNPCRYLVESDVFMIAIYYACATLSGAFGGLIAYGVQSDLAFQGGRKPWSWLFLIEGVLAAGVGLIIILALPRFPDDLHRRQKRHWLFTSEEIELAYKRYNGKSPLVMSSNRVPNSRNHSLQCRRR